MKKHYSKELGEWVMAKKTRVRDKNLVAFLSVKADVQDALNEGYSVKTIWEHMYEKKRIEFGYDTFLNYTNRLIRRKKEIPDTEKNEQHPTTTKNETTKQGKEQQPTTEQKPAQVTGFKFNPIPNKEELY